LEPELTGDRILIHDLQFDCVIGVNEEERTRKQRIITDIVLYTDLSRAGASDSIDDTTSYSELAGKIVAFAQRSSYMLIEKLAEEIACICLACEKVAGVRVLVKKPGAVPQAAYAGVEICRRR